MAPPTFNNPSMMEAILTIIKMIHEHDGAVSHAVFENDTVLEEAMERVKTMTMLLDDCKRCDHAPPTKADQAAFEDFPNAVAGNLSFYPCVGQHLAGFNPPCDPNTTRDVGSLASFAISLVEAEDMIHNSGLHNPDCVIVMTQQVSVDCMLSMALLFSLFFNHFKWGYKVRLVFVVENLEDRTKITDLTSGLEAVLVSRVADPTSDIIPFDRYTMPGRDTRFLFVTSDYQTFKRHLDLSGEQQTGHRINLLTPLLTSESSDIAVELEEMANAGSVFVEAFPLGARSSERSVRVTQSYSTKDLARPGWLKVCNWGTEHRLPRLETYYDEFNSMIKWSSQGEQCYDCTVVRYLGTLLDIAMNGKDECADDMYNKKGGEVVVELSVLASD